MTQRGIFWSLAAAAVAVSAIALWQSDFFAIDACLDHGGHWDYTTAQCEGALPNG